VGEAGDPGVDFLSLAGLLPLVVLSPDRRNEFWRDRPVPEPATTISHDHEKRPILYRTLQNSQLFLYMGS
jgi:hypothetical protein